MDSPVINMPEIILSDETLKQVEALAKQTTPDEALWISGYFAGWARSKLATSNATRHASSLESVNNTNDSEKPSLCILYGTETGNSFDLAEKLTAILRDEGYVVSCSDIDDFKIQRLKKEKYVLMITSTHGDGDPPETAKTFFEAIAGRKAPNLEHLQYAVLGLGDLSYEYFCEAAKYIDKRFSELGAKSLIERVDCDVDYDEAAGKWIEGITLKLKELIATEETTNKTTIYNTGQNEPVEDVSTQEFDKRHPFEAEVIESIKITGNGSTKHISHIEVSLEGSGLSYLPGDALGVIPVNASSNVDDILTALNLTGEEHVNDDSKTLRESLLYDYDITTLTSRFLEAWYGLSKAESLKEFLPTQERALLFEYASRNHIVDVIQKYPVSSIDPLEFLKGLRKLQPRLYSIASSQDMLVDEAHITVSKVEYQLHQRDRHGVASFHLCSQLEPGQTVPVYIQKNNNFRLPEDTKTPIIMIGAGTGIAPYRAFLQHRETSDIKSGTTWLFFGERNFRTDFLYQTEWQRWLRDGYLDRISLAFSRDGKEKVYVQHRLIEEGKDVFKWLEKGACIYVCGDASYMAKDVDKALLTIIQNEGQMSAERANEYLKILSQQKRYRKDVY